MLALTGVGFRTSVSRRAEASVRVLRDDEVVLERQDQRPGLVISLPTPGGYLIEVIQNGTDVRDSVRVSVAE